MATWLAVLECACATVAPRQSAAPSSVEAQSGSSDASVERLLTALKRPDFKTARADFDATMKTALPEWKLIADWYTVSAAKGKLKDWTIVERKAADDLDVRVALLTLERGQLQATIAVRRDTWLIAGLYFKNPPAPPATPPPYANAAAFHSVEVRVGAAPSSLGGTLTLPRGDGPFPAVVLVHGSGPEDRDESIGANHPFKDLGEGLATRGIAVLRYDKRTFAYHGAVMHDIGVDDEVELDAIAAVKLLETRPEIDPRRVFVLGHSLGALLAPEIAVRAATAAGVILLSPPGRLPWDILVDQYRYLNVSPERLAEVERKAELLRHDQLGSDDLIGVPAAYWKDLASRDGVAMAKRLGKPILILHGDRDYQVTDADLAIWHKGLDGWKDVRFETIPGANHLFILGSGKPGPAEYGIPGHVDARVVNDVVSFILATTR